MRSFVLTRITAALLLIITGCGERSATLPGKAEEDTLYSGANFNDHIRSTTARPPEEERAGFKLPEGFEIKLYASEPDIGKPINFNFDAQGRMWVTQSFEYPFPANPGHGRDRLTILEDTDGDGRADKFTHVTDTLNIPIGVMPLQDGAVVYSIPNVLALSNQNTDGSFKKSRKLLGPFEHKDTHGMVNNLTMGFDGWIHACHGYTNHSAIAGSDGRKIELISGSTFRFREDGKTVEQETAGRVNPFGLAYDELGYLYSTDCHSSPLYQLIKGADYPQSGKDEGIGFAPDMKPFDNEATALAGLAYYADTCFPEPYRKNLFIGDAVASRVYRNSFVFNGSSPIGKKEPDFIKSRDPWFRPVAVQMGPDGALYIADFYNSIIGHYEVPLNHPKRDKIRGRIWRVTYKGKTTPTIKWNTAEINALTGALSGSNLASRMMAMNQLVVKGPEVAITPVMDMMKNERSSPVQYVHGLWILQQWGKLNDSLLQKAMGSSSIDVRVHALRTMREKKEVGRALETLVMNALRDPSAHVRRAAVEMMSRFPSPETIARLTQLLDSSSTADTHLRYTTRLILRNLLGSPALLAAAGTFPWKPSEAKWLSGIMIGVEGPLSGLFVLRYLQQNESDIQETGRLLRHAIRWVPFSQLDSVVDIGKRRALNNPAAEVKIYSSLMEGFERRGIQGNMQFQDWGKQLAMRILQHSIHEEPGGKRDLSPLYFAVATAGKYKMNNTYPFLVHSFADSSLPLDGRLLVLRTIFTLVPDSIAIISKKLLADPSTSTEYKRSTVTVMADFPSKELSDVVSAVPDPAPDLQWWIVIVLASSEYGQDLLLAKAKSGEVPAQLLTEPMIAERLALKQSPRHRTDFATITGNVIDGEKQKQQVISQRIADYTALQKKPEASDGQPIFQKNCSPCHSIGGQGGQVGPQLDGVGKWGVTSLVEKILDPNRNVSENFINYTLTLRNGQVLSGLYRRQDGAVEVYVNLSGKEFTVPLADIVKKTKAKYTLMPDQFRNTIAAKDFESLLSYLLSQQTE